MFVWKVDNVNSFCSLVVKVSFMSPIQLSDILIKTATNLEMQLFDHSSGKFGFTLHTFTVVHGFRMKIFTQH